MREASSKILVLMGVSLLSFTGFLDATIVSTALPSIQVGLQMTVTELQWVMNAFFLGISAFMASMGRIADLYGRRRVFYIGTLIFGLASLGAGLSPNGTWLIFFRAIQGISTAITIPVGIALIQTVFAQQEIAKAMGIFATITGSGLALGPVVGGALVTAFGWPSVFLVNIPFVIIGFAICLSSVKESKSSASMSLDYFGILFLTLTIASLVFAVVEANVFGWGSPLILGSFIIFILSFILLIVTESKVAYPIMKGSLFKNRSFMAAVMFSFVSGGLMSIVLFVDPLYIHSILNKSVWMTGVILFTIPLVVMATSSPIGHINHHLGPRKVMLYGCLFLFLAAVLHLFFQIELNYFLILPCFILFGLGWAIANQAPAVALGQSIHSDLLGVAIGSLLSFFNIGAAVMLAIAVTLFHWRAKQSLIEHYTQNNYPLHPTDLKLINQFVNQPDQINQVIQQLNPSYPITEEVFKNAFVTGMHLMYWPIVFLVIIAFITLKGIKKNPA